MTSHQAQALRAAGSIGDEQGDEMLFASSVTLHLTWDKIPIIGLSFRLVDESLTTSFRNGLWSDV